MGFLIHCDVCHAEHNEQDFVACEACYNEKAEEAEEDECKCEEKDKEIEQLEEKIADLKYELKSREEEADYLNKRINDLELELDRNDADEGMGMGGIKT